MQASPYAFQRGHRFSAECMRTAEARRTRETLRGFGVAHAVAFTAAGAPLGKVSRFKYLGRHLSDLDNDWPSLQKQLTKTRQRWAMISRVLSWEGANPRVSGMFHKVATQAVMVYGSETWVFSESKLQALQGFHHRVARRLTGRMPRQIHVEDH